jgi:hypothetical protein
VVVFVPPDLDLVVVVPLQVLLDYEGLVLFVFSLFFTGKHLVRCRRRSGVLLVASVAALAVPQRFKHTARPDLC